MSSHPLSLFKSALFLPLCLALLSLSLFAQEYRGRVQGSVTDPSGAPVAGATVTLHNDNTGVSDTRTTAADGLYLFDLVQPGTYTVTVESQGFSKSVHPALNVEERGNVTANSSLQIGTVSSQVVVQDVAPDIDFNSAALQTTLNATEVADTPNYNRNPFLLAQLNPQVVDTRPYNPHPYDTWGSNSLSIGGGAQFSNELQVDGSPITIGLKSSYVPNTDAVQELNVQVNAVDAEFGHSTGAVISLALKSGSNQYHGELFYRGHFPWMNAVTDRTSPDPTVSLEREHYIGGTFANPIIHNKLFNFASFEYQYREDPGSYWATVPTALERDGNYSQSLNAEGTPLLIYNPATTVTDSQGNVTRQQYAGNIIQPSQQDPVARAMAQMVWAPNTPGIGPNHVNNYFANTPQLTKYKNFMDRVDYNLGDKWRFNGYTGVYFAPTGAGQGGPDSPLSPVPFGGGETKGTNISVDATYTLSANTVIDFAGEYHSLFDSSVWPSGKSSDGYAQYYPNDKWYSLLTIPGIGLSPFAPSININSPGSGLSLSSNRGQWYSSPDGYSFHGKISHQTGPHFIKAGADYRYDYGKSAVDWLSGFGFYPNTTANTYVNPDLNKSGDAFASFLTGALGDPANQSWAWGNGSLMTQNILNTPYSQFYGFFVNDDWKVTRNLTITAGLRYEYETPWKDAQDRLSRGPDFSQTIPTLANNPPQMPSVISQYYTGTPQWTGAWEFATSSHSGGWNALGDTLLPRFGVAYRINDRTAVSGAWARWAQPWMQTGYGAIGSFLDYVYPGYDTTQAPAPMINGVPQVYLSNPFPASNPIIPAQGKSLGIYSELGQGGIDVAYQDRKKAINDRFNINIQRELPFGTVLKADFYYNYTHDLGYTWYPNMVDPRLLYKYGGALNSLVVANPFYNYGTPQTFPGPLRNQQTVSALSLMVPYPQYGNINEEQKPGAASRYRSFDFTLQRKFRGGLTYMFAYTYVNETDTQFFNNTATYLQQFSWIPSINPRNRISSTFVWDMPVGRGRKFFSGMPRYADAIFGGWGLSSVITYNSGGLIDFSGQTMLYQQGCNINQHTPGTYFNTSCFSIQPNYTDRSNPWNFPGLTGPGYFNIDATLAKTFKITEKWNASFHVSAFNALNNLNLGGVDVGLFDGSAFGTDLYQNGNSAGRKMELGAKLQF